MKYVFYTDGATEGPNGKLGTVKFIGVGFHCPELDYEFSVRTPGRSNNDAEFKALLLAMGYARERGLKEVEFRSDSRITINRANGARPTSAKFKNERMDFLQDCIMQLKKSFDKCTFTWVPREHNRKADILSKRKLLNQNSYGKFTT